jgi:hypothetical protein
MAAANSAVELHIQQIYTHTQLAIVAIAISADLLEALSV